MIVQTHLCPAPKREVKFLASFALSILVCLFVTPTASVVAQSPPPTYAREYRQNFKGPPKNPNEFFFMGPDAESHVKFEGEGLRIKLPAGHPSGTDTGLMTRFGVQGDFEITLKYEILQEPEPNDAGAQTRFSLYVIQDTNKLYRASINRHCTGGPAEFLTWMEVPGLTPGKSDTKVDTIPAPAKTGRFRLARQGTELSFFAAEGDDASFKLLQKYTFGAGNLRNVRIAAATGGPQAAVDVRVTDFLIRAAAFPRLDKIAAQEAKPLQKDAPTYHEPFKGQPQKRQDFVLIGKDADKRVKFEPEGLRITLPAGAPAWQPTGVATAFGVAGDFEASVRYEILAEPEPADAGSVGTQISLTANVGGVNINDASIRHKVLPFRPAHVRLNTSAEKITDYFPVKEKTGRLRMVRTGDLIAYYSAEGFDEEFKLLTTHPFDAADVKEIQISGQSSGPRAALDVRFTDFQIRAASLARNKYAQEYHEPFKGPPKNASDFTLIGADALKCVKFEPEGLRITMPAGKTRGPTGVATSFGLKGDFEITVRYEIFQEPEPADAGTLAIGTRISLRVNLNRTDLSEASIRRKVTPSQPVHILTYRSVRRAGDSEPDKLENRFPVKEKTGRFRMVRTGADITYYVAEGFDEEFRRLTTYSFGADDVKNVQIYGGSSSTKAALDARFSNLHMRAASLGGHLVPPKTVKSNEPAPLPKSDKVAEPEVPTKEYAQTYDQPFKGNGVKPAGWEFTTPAAEEWLKFEPAGLRLALPSGWRGERPAAGLRSIIGVKGDFEITYSFDILKGAAAEDFGKFDTRLSLGVTLDNALVDTPKAEAATLNWRQSSKGDRTFSTWMRSREYPKGVSGGKSIPATTGRLRFVRSGDELFFLASAGAEQPFTLIRKYRFGADDLKRVAITATTLDEAAALDVRITDFRIRADAILGAPSAAAAAEPQTPAAPQREGSGSWLIAGLLVVLAIALGLALIIGARFLVRKRGVRSEAIPTSVSFACPHCDKGLKTKPQMAGKKVKCAKCGKAVLVPAPR